MSHIESRGHEGVTLQLGSNRVITLHRGLMILIRDGASGCYGAVIESIGDIELALTFVPEGKPRTVPMGLVVSTAAESGPLVDPDQVPAVQPPPTVAPRRRKTLIQ